MTQKLIEWINYVLLSYGRTNFKNKLILLLPSQCTKSHLDSEHSSQVITTELYNYVSRLVFDASIYSGCSKVG